MFRERREGTIHPLQNNGIVVVRFVHPRRDRPHGHGLRGKRNKEIAGVGLPGTEPAVVMDRGNDHRHPIMDRPDEVIGGAGDNGEGSNPLIRSRPLPVLPNARQRKRFAALLPYGIGSLGLTPRIAFHSKKLSTGTRHLRRL